MTDEHDAANPATDPARLAELAQTRPQLRPIIAANPAAYEGLLQWLTQFDEPGLRSALAVRGYAVAPVMVAPKRRVPIAVLIGAVILALVVGGGATVLAFNLAAQSSPSSLSPGDDDEDQEDENDTDTSAVDPCSIDQVQAVALDGVAAETITLIGDFPLPELFDAGTSVLCAGDYDTSDADAYRPGSSVLILSGGEGGFDALDRILQGEGFPEFGRSGVSTHGWNDGNTQVYAVRLEDQVNDSYGADFGDDDDLIVVVTWPEFESKL